MSEIRKIRIKDVDYDIKSKITISTSNLDSDFLVAEPLNFDTLSNGKQKIILNIGTSLTNNQHMLDVRVSENGGINIKNTSTYAGLALNVNDLNLEILENKLQIKEDAYIKCNDGNHVPLRHPDISTQPSILPYRFMGNYVYEQLIPKSSFNYIGSSHDVYLKDANLEVSNPIILDACLIYSSGILYNNVIIEDGRLIWQCSAKQESDFLFAKIIYTTIPEEGAYYYYNESVGLFDKYVELFGESNFIINQGLYFDCDSPNIYNGDEFAYTNPTSYKNVFTFTLTEDYLNTGSVGINCNIKTNYYADIYILNELITTFELSAHDYIYFNGNEYRDAVLNKQLRIVVRTK